MHIHILGIGGTLMGSIALLAKEQGHCVTGSDKALYPPMSDQLAKASIEAYEGFKPYYFEEVDVVLVGNAYSRGNPAIEYVLEHDLPFCSGPEWLKTHILQDKRVIAVSGTHGKTTTASLIAWILEDNGLNPSFLIGGVPKNFTVSARLTDSEWFVIEADEYDTAFFDKRSKFLHYKPDVLIINNIEFDHADIFDDIAAIQKQFHHLIRTIPPSGHIIYNKNDQAIVDVLTMGVWSKLESFGSNNADWSLSPNSKQVCSHGQEIAELNWSVLGEHNAQNALVAVAACEKAGIQPIDAIESLSQFKGVTRRLEQLACVNGVTVYDDFAHHPTAIKKTLHSLKEAVGANQLVLVMEPRSNTMKLGCHKEALIQAFVDADEVYFYQPPNLSWQVEEILDKIPTKCHVFGSVEEILSNLYANINQGQTICFMSNGGFEGVQKQFVDGLKAL